MRARPSFRFPQSLDIAFGRGAFSLIEVALAMGIISFSLLVILGLMPVGLNTMRQAMDSTQKAQILRRISGEVMLTPWTKLKDVEVKKRFFDDEGQEQTITSMDENTRYWAQLSVTNILFPGSAPNAGLITNSLQSVKVTLVSVNASPNERTNTFSIPVANSGN